VIDEFVEAHLSDIGLERTPDPSVRRTADGTRLLFETREVTQGCSALFSIRTEGIDLGVTKWFGSDSGAFDLDLGRAEEAEIVFGYGESEVFGGSAEPGELPVQFLEAGSFRGRPGFYLVKVLRDSKLVAAQGGTMPAISSAKRDF
jgi:hypothetical protein